MSGACGVPVVHAASVRPLAARSGLWLAVAFHAGSTGNSRGSETSSSGKVHIVFRFPVVARTRATSAGVTNAARVAEVVADVRRDVAIHSSFCAPIGTITFV